MAPHTYTNIGWKWDNSYAALPKDFYSKLSPTPVAAPQNILLNQSLAESLGLHFDTASTHDIAEIFAGNHVPDGADPLAQAYAGHQFGHFTFLGDGRAHLLGEHITPKGTRVDVQFKGSGPTPYSRHGDGRAAIGPMLREYIISEAMHALGVPTTRSLAVTLTGEPVMRETMLQGAVLTRISSSHIRVGTFEFFAAQEDLQGLKTLADYTINRHYSDLKKHPQPYLALLHALIEKQADLVAKWLHVGFVHGVMNTDNMTLCGETIDYGPCAFLDVYDPATVFSSIDEYGRYGYRNQPHMTQWNLARFAEAMLPLLDDDIRQAAHLAEEAVNGFGDIFQRKWLDGMAKKLGLLGNEPEDTALIKRFLQWMQQQQIDFTLGFRGLSTSDTLDATLYTGSVFHEWHSDWQARLARNDAPIEAAYEVMRTHNPAIIARNHRVEEAIADANEGNYDTVKILLEALREPYADKAEYADYTHSPASGATAYQTFCGT